MDINNINNITNTEINDGNQPSNHKYTMSMVFMIFFLVMLCCHVFIYCCDCFGPSNYRIPTRLRRKYTPILKIVNEMTYAQLIQLDGQDGEEISRTCSICLESYQKSDKVIRIKCHHIFHTN